MDQDVLTEELNRLVAIENNGLLRNLKALSPHLTARSQQIWPDLLAMSRTSIEHAAILSRLVSRLRLATTPASYGFELTEHSYTTLEHLLPMLIEEKRRVITSYETALKHLGDAPADVRSTVESLLEENRKEQEALAQHHRDLVGDDLPEMA